MNILPYHRTNPEPHSVPNHFPLGIEGCIHPATRRLFAPTFRELLGDLDPLQIAFMPSQRLQPLPFSIRLRSLLRIPLVGVLALAFRERFGSLLRLRLLSGRGGASFHFWGRSTRS